MKSNFPLILSAVLACCVNACFASGGLKGQANYTLSECQDWPSYEMQLGTRVSCGWNYAMPPIVPTSYNTVTFDNNVAGKTTVSYVLDNVSKHQQTFDISYEYNCIPTIDHRKQKILNVSVASGKTNKGSFQTDCGNTSGREFAIQFQGAAPNYDNTVNITVQVDSQN